MVTVRGTLQSEFRGRLGHVIGVAEIQLMLEPRADILIEMKLRIHAAPRLFAAMRAMMMGRYRR